jgi:hypothetical protein
MLLGGFNDGDVQFFVLPEQPGRYGDPGVAATYYDDLMLVGHGEKFILQSMTTGSRDSVIAVT